MTISFAPPLLMLAAASSLLLAAGCDGSKKRMLAPPAEREEILVPTVAAGQPAGPVVVVAAEPPKALQPAAGESTQEITLGGAADITVERKPARPVAKADAFFHQCSQGDSIQSVAKEYNVDARELAKINGFGESATFSPKTLLVLPRSLDKIAQAPDVATYTVVAGDTYSRIARQHRISPQVLMHINKAASPNLQIGDVLYVPKPR
ncbi:LysM peptidoglycan-binding domain-containing protein [bacterium]|nr:LysM peptidoglycan-binding domain-containing protein [bacterium]